MIIGECPYCGEINSTEIAPNPPCYSKEKCETCNKEYWLRHSRLDPMAFPIDYFILVNKILVRNNG